MSKLAVIFDGNNLVQRAYHAHRRRMPDGSWESLSTSDGRESGAIYGTIVMFSSYMKKLAPDYVFWTFDWGRSKKRTELDPEYKSNRVSSNRENLKPQFGAIEEFLSMIDVAHYRENGTEADDLMASAARKFAKHDIKSIIVTSDHDLRQVVNQDISVLKPGVGSSKNAVEKLFTLTDTIEHYGIEPERLPELWALTGDPGDGIPGVPRVGFATAKKLIEKYGDLWSLVDNGDKKIQGHEERILLNYDLISLKEHHDVPISPEDCTFEPDLEDFAFMKGFLEDWEMKSIVKRFEEGTMWS